MKVLDGTFAEGGPLDVAHDRIQELMAGGMLNNAMSIIENLTGITLPPGTNLTVEFKDLGYESASMRSTGNGDYTLSINYTMFDGSVTPSGEGPYMWNNMSLDRLVAHELMHAVMDENAAHPESIPRWFAEGLAVAIEAGSDTRLAGENIGELLENFSVDTSLKNAYSAGYLAVMYMDHYAGGGAISTLMNNLQTHDFDTAVFNTFGITMEEMAAEIRAGANDVPTFLTDASVSLTRPSSLNNNSYANAASVIPNGAPTAYTQGETLAVGSTNVIMNWAETVGGNPLFLQVGANEGQGMLASIRKVSSRTLGLLNVGVMDPHGAQALLTYLDRAVERLSSERANLGVYQNRLEHTINNLNVGSENLSASESRIRDTDMALEMMNYTKSNVLQQAGVSMLAQANQKPEAILRLLC